jgi:mycothiol synthase
MDRSASSLIYRPLDLQHDLAALVTLLNDVEQADHTGEDVTEATLREQLTWSGQDPALNNWVVTLPDDGSLVAYGIVQKIPSDDNAHLYIAVHPEWRRQGIGSQILARLLERVHDLGARAIGTYVNAQNEGIDLFARSYGFEPVSAYTRLGVSVARSFPAPALPPDFTTRSFDQIQHVDLYTQAMNRSYEGLWGHIQLTQEEVVRWLPQLNQAGIFLLFAPDEGIAGTCRAEISEQLSAARGAPTALIDAPGVVPAYRDANLYLPLLLTAIHWLLPQNPATLELESWGDAPDTLALYRSLGFAVMKEEVSYRLSLER